MSKRYKVTVYVMTPYATIEAKLEEILQKIENSC